MGTAQEFFMGVVLVLLLLSPLIPIAAFVVLGRPWLRALLGRAPVPLTRILGMRLRGSPPMLLINAYIALKDEGFSVTIDEVEREYVGARDLVSTSDDLVKLVKQRAHDPQL